MGPSVNWLSYLPYADAAEADGDSYLAAIRDGFSAAILAGDLKSSGIVWCRHLHRYLDLKYTLPLPDLQKFATILYHIITTPNIESSLVETYSELFCKLVKKRRTLPDDAIVLPWKPLFDCMKGTFLLKKRDRPLRGSVRHYTILVKVAYLSRRFFPTDAAKEVFQELLQYIDPRSLSQNVLVTSVVALFLPTNGVPVLLDDFDRVLAEIVGQNPSIQLDPPLDGRPPAVWWVPMLLAIWSENGHTGAYDGVFFDILAHLAEDQVSTPWNVKWNENHVRQLLAVGMRHLELPVGTSNGGSGTSAGAKVGNQGGAEIFEQFRKSKFESLAKFLIYTAYPDPDDEGFMDVDSVSRPPATRSLFHLGILIRAVETYFHPSNTGRWTWTIVRFIQRLSAEFLRRLKEESLPTCKTPLSYRLTKSMSREFVKILTTPTFLAMYGKDPYSVIASHTTLKYLSWIDPVSVLPGLLERAYPALETLTETHRTTSTISALSACIVPLLRRNHFPQGGKHIGDLLMLVCPGIDVNDLQKSSAAILFMVNAVSCVALVDLTKVDRPADEVDCSNIEVEGGEPGVSLQDEHDLCRQSTAQFEDFISKYLERVWNLFENLPENYGAKSSKNAEESIVGLLVYSAEVIFSQCSPELLAYGIKKVLNYVTSTVTPNASAPIAMFVGAMNAVQTNEVLDSFFPVCYGKIMDELSSGASSSWENSNSSSNPYGFASMSDSTFHWYQAIFMWVVRNSGVQLLKWKTELRKLLAACIDLCRSRRGYKWAAKTFQHVIKGLISVYTTEHRSVNPDKWNDPKYMASSHLHWGESQDPRELKLIWHVPSEEELSLALEIVEETASKVKTNLKSVMKEAEQGSKSSREMSSELVRWINLYRNILASISTLTIVSEDGNIENTPGEDDDLPAFSKRVHAHTVPPDHPVVKRMRAIELDLINELHEVFQFFSVCHEDDTAAQKALAKAIRVVVAQRGVSHQKVDSALRVHKMMKGAARVTPGNNSGADPSSELPKELPRQLVVRRAMYSHYSRVSHNNREAGTAMKGSPVVQNLLDDLLQMSLGRYAAVRTVSQSALSTSMRANPWAKRGIFLQLVKALELDPDAPKDEESVAIREEKMKGALYLLLRPTFLRVSLQRFDNMAPFQLALVQAQHSDKPSIQELVRKALVEHFINAYVIQLDFAVRPKVEELVLQLHTSGTPASVQGEMERLKAKVSRRSVASRADHNSLMSSLISLILSGKLHWRYEAMALNFIEMHLRRDEPVPANLASILMDGVNSELPSKRKACISLLVRSFLYIKDRAIASEKKKSSIAGRSRVHSASSMEFVPPAQVTSEYKSSYVAESCKEIESESVWTNTTFIDNSSVGWLVWGKSRAYKGVPTQASSEKTLPYVDSESAAFTSAVHARLSTPEWWESLERSFSQEGNITGEDDQEVHARYIKTITSFFEDDEAVFDQGLKPVVERLVAKTDEKSHQLAATVILAGLVRGSKHWGFQSWKRMWEWVLPLVERAILAAKPESTMFWQHFIQFVCTDRDPRRVMPLVKLVMRISVLDPTAQSFFAEAKKLLNQRTLFSVLSWRLEPFIRPILEEHLELLPHPYKQVRELLGSSISLMFQELYVPGCGSVTEVAIWSMLQSTGDDCTKGIPVKVPESPGVRPWVPELLDNVVQKLLKWKSEEAGVERVPGISTKYGNALKTVAIWYADSLLSWRSTGVFPYAHDYMVPVILDMVQYQDTEVLDMSSKLMMVLPTCAFSAQLIPKVLAQLVSAAQSHSRNGSTETGSTPSVGISSGTPPRAFTASPDLGSTTQQHSWHVRRKVLPAIQLLYFHHLFYMSDDLMVQVMRTVGSLLSDPQLEVREYAGQTLSGLIRCSQRGAIETLRVQFEGELRVTKLASRGKRRQDALSGELTQADLVTKRHGAVLGLSSLVQAFPYDVPAWAPDVLVTIAGCLGDPAPISTTVRKVFADFKRTHQDTWHEDSQKFDENQLSVLTDLLISPSYYA
ncbi:hypothetical protein BJ742DRAFT_820531 [Cladochytrium replicatum]|nr:hypothetical protein BJ742DRAFT_820531 [Cladochytrium replicatum]